MRNAAASVRHIDPLMHHMGRVPSTRLEWVVKMVWVSPSHSRLLAQPGLLHQFAMKVDEQRPHELKGIGV
jgi:hypothetical protein